MANKQLIKKFSAAIRGVDRASGPLAGERRDPKIDKKLLIESLPYAIVLAGDP